MAENDGFEDHHHHHLGGGSFSQLLLSDDVDHGGFNFYSSSSFLADQKPPKMLCFGSYESVFSDSRTPQKSGVTCSDSSSASSGNNHTANFSSLSNSNAKKRNGSGQEQTEKQSMNSQKVSRKTKTESNQSSTGHVKVRKEKLGERIVALQQLVSPFGKTDTASVLHEAMGYIRFLHEQVQVLCSPYLQALPCSDGGENREDGSKEMRSRGLCLVPVEWTVHVANTNGADFWSPAMVNRE